MMLPIIVTFNVGSATIKMAAYDAEKNANVSPLQCQALFDVNIHLKTQQISWHGDIPTQLINWKLQDDLSSTAVSLLQQLQSIFYQRKIVCVHRVVHGGLQYHHPVIINPKVFADLSKLSSICPLHQPPALSVVTALQRFNLHLTQIAVFDTAFHASRSKLWAEYALPAYVRDNGIRCYGFHGLSYQAIMRKITTHLPHLINKRLIVAHLGSGCSVTAIRQGQSQDSTLGFSGLDGVPMATRVGHLDSGVILYMIEQGWTLEKINQCLYKESGLLGLSGVSGDIRDLLNSDNDKAKFAVDYFAAHTAKEIASLLVSIQGMDALVFTAGIGEHSATIRQKVVDYLNFLGLSIDKTKNQENSSDDKAISAIHHSNSQTEIWVIPTNEQLELYLGGLQALVTH